MEKILFLNRLDAKQIPGIPDGVLSIELNLNLRTLHLMLHTARPFFNVALVFLQLLFMSIWGSGEEEQMWSMDRQTRGLIGSRQVNDDPVSMSKTDTPTGRLQLHQHWARTYLSVEHALSIFYLLLFFLLFFLSKPTPAMSTHSSCTMSSRFETILTNFWFSLAS